MDESQQHHAKKKNSHGCKVSDSVYDILTPKSTGRDTKVRSAVYRDVGQSKKTQYREARRLFFSDNANDHRVDCVDSYTLQISPDS